MFGDVLRIGALLNKSLSKTVGGPPKEDPLNEMVKRVIGILGVGAIAGTPGAYDIGAHPPSFEFLNIFSLCSYEFPCPMIMPGNHCCGAALRNTS